MIDLSNLPQDLKNILVERYGERVSEIKIPPTAFTTMQGQLIEYDIDNGYLKTMFPVLDNLLNQFGNMQGGMIAAAVDNTFGPLSMLIAPPNFTRTLEVKYKRPVSPEIKIIFVEARLLSIKSRQILLEAAVLAENNSTLATAKATHWIL